MIKWIVLLSTTLCAQEIPLDSLVADLPESATLTSKKIVRQRLEDAKIVYNWGVGQSPFPIPKIVVSALKRNASKRIYTSVEGVPELAEALSDFYTHGKYVIEPKNVLVAAGLKQLTLDVQKAFGGEILHIRPYWVSYKDQALLTGKTPVVLSTKRENDFKVTPEEVELHCKADPEKKRMILFNHPVNPTGVCYSSKELEALAQVFRKYNIIVFADEVYLSLTHNGKEVSISEFLPELTIRASSLSKDVGAAGWRLGWAVFPRALFPLKHAMSKLGGSSYSCAPIPQQYAAIVALERPKQVQGYLNKLRSILKPLSHKVTTRLHEMNLDCIEPSAAWYVWVGFDKYKESLKKVGIHTSKDLVDRLAKEIGVVFVVGSAFGMEEDSLYVRGAYVDFSGERGLQEFRMKDPQFDFASELFDGLDILNRWLNQMETFN